MVRLITTESNLGSQNIKNGYEYSFELLRIVAVKNIINIEISDLFL